MTRLYLVDDHQMVREGLRAVLEAAGHQVLGEADEPTRALGEILRLSPDVLLLDMQLGERSGLEILTELQRREHPVRVICLTMSAQPHQVAEALRLGASGYVLKGSSASEMLKAIEMVHNGRRFLGPQVADLALQVLTGAAGADPLGGLSPRERQIIVMVSKGHSSAQIGQQLHLSPKTVDTYRSRLMAKLSLPDLAAVVRFAVRHGLIEADGP